MTNVDNYENPKRSQGRSALRACLLCAMIKTYDDFLAEGCDNCEKYLRMVNRSNSVLDCTSANYSGKLILLKPDDSWVGDRLHHHSHVGGLYALQIFGRLPDSIQEDLLEKGVRYIPRDCDTQMEGETGLE